MLQNQEHLYSGFINPGKIFGSPVSKFDICQMANYNLSMNENEGESLGKIIKRQRLAIPLTLRELTTAAGISSSHLGRIERGERFPSAHVLRKIAGHLGFDEDELFVLAGYRSPRAPTIAEASPEYGGKRLDPYVARMLAQEPADMQRAVISILTILKSIAIGITRESR